MITESTHIHNKAIFDAFNEAINNFRIYNTKGAPMPWDRARPLMLAHGEGKN